MIRRALRDLFIAAGLLAFGLPTASAQFYRVERPDAYLRDNAKMKALVKPILADVSKSVVKILSDKKEICLGTVVGRDGWIITKYSELRGDNLLVKFKDGREFIPKIVGVEDNHDIAMLKIDAKDLPTIEWRDSKTAKLGHFVLSAGIDSDPLAIGVVSVLTRPMKTIDYPVANRNRNSGWLGVGLGRTVDGGVLITQVAKDSGGEKAGLKLDDVVISISGRKMSDSESMILHLLRYRIGDEIVITIKRGEEEIDVTATLGKRPSEFAQQGLDRGMFQNGIHKNLSFVNVGFPIALQHDSVLDAKQIGGPLVDLDGKVVGINIASAGRVDSYAIPSEVIQVLLIELMSGKRAPPEKKQARKPEPTKKPEEPKKETPNTVGQPDKNKPTKPEDTRPIREGVVPKSRSQDQNDK
jgi:serine protease Do